jgi:hypothetical protein
VGMAVFIVCVLEVQAFATRPSVVERSRTECVCVCVCDMECYQAPQ